MKRGVSPTAKVGRREVQIPRSSPAAIVRAVGNPASASRVLCDKRRALICIA
jgi:hypothetical protein